MMKLVYAGLLFLFGGFALWAGLRVSGEVRKGRGWPTVQGKISERRLETAAQLRSRAYEPRATYTYVVDGVSYTNDQVYLMKGTSGTARSMQALLDGLPETVTVHYDPSQPSRSYLIVNPRSTSWIMVGAAALALLLGLAQLLMYWHQRKPGS
jgi:Protein of unknown function (DUF3592)